MAPPVLNSMANYNEKTISKIHMCVFRKFNMSLPDNAQLHFSEWNYNNNYITCGGALGTLKVVKIGLDPVDTKQNPATASLIVNQTLEGHQTTVLIATWNENHQKLTTSDTSGLIIVWGLFNEQWVEEMINNRNKSVVVGIVWNQDGTKIAIAYADGNVIVGTLEGNRIWNKELDMQLAACEWAPDGEMLIFGTADGKVVVFDETGSHFLDIPMHCLETEDLEQALAKKENQREEIVVIKYWSPTLKSKAVMEEMEKEWEKEMAKEREPQGTAVFNNYPTQKPHREYVEPDKSSEPHQPIPPDRPRFMVAYQRGILQLMRSIQDPEPVVVRLPNVKITGAKWSPNGAFIAISGTDLDKEEPRHSHIHFLSAYGHKIGFFQHFETRITGICWEGTGLRMSIAADGNLFIGHVRPEFKWGALVDAIVYVFQREELSQYTVMFYDHKTDEKHPKTVTYFENMAFFHDHCVIVSRQDDQSLNPNQYYCQLCNSIGTSIDHNFTTIPPKFLCVNGMCAVVANKDRYCIWHFVLPKYNSVQAGIHIPGKAAEYNLEEQQRPGEYGGKRSFGSKDEICAICIGDTFFLMALLSGGIFYANLSDGSITKSFPISATIDSMRLNCKYNRLAIVKLVEQVPFSILLYEFDGEQLSKIYACEKKDIWDYKWDTNEENMLAFKDKHKLFICDGTSLLEQSNVYGNIVSFKNLTVTAVSLEKILMNPEMPTKNALQEVLIKAKQEVTNLLNSMKLDEAIDYAERTPHSELWTMIAQYALFKQQFDSAEHAFVKLGDYAGVQLLKRLRLMTSRELRNAEVMAYQDKYEEAKQLFLQCDRKDLAVEMFKKVGDSKAVYDLIKNDPDEHAKKEAFRDLAETAAELMDYDDAAKWYGQSGDTGEQIDCLIRGNMFGELEVLARALPDDSDFMEVMGDAFTSRGMCDQAVECYLRKSLPQKALKACMELNQWQKAQFIADANHMENVDGLLGKYAIEMKGESDEKSLNALALYMRAGRHLDAAKIAFDIAKDRRDKYVPYEELKQCYVLGAILVENHRQTIKELRKIDKHNVLEDALDDESGLTVEQSRILENTWRGAEAYHFMMLAQQHFFEHRIEDALQTSLSLSDYEEFLDPAEIYSMIALAAANVKQFGICSKAMMRLEALDDFEEAEKDEMRNLSFRLFSKHPPVNPNSAKVPCTACDAMIDPFDMQCKECQTKFPVCIASGRLILDNIFWLCPRCKHRAHQHEIMKYSYCPLCHDMESFRPT
ncbi:hypothetical protein GCK72_011693 [Caenorhabditis remanei]|uniref:Uncharacterized protein n=1 Tax=Caenorhabditis remanei TaxID=31234 RepID=A0A6A5H8A2_CAERE|nr:hypothetical protein GCK72_011693 [Caenorhabditis remanei]KAF1763427.1 hypothetical protein GCK72_011693 [Caenorhabditis remanei]